MSEPLSLVCPSCKARATTGQRFCGSCGALLPASSETDTTLAPAVAAVSPYPTPDSKGGFLPGTILVSRYRIAGLIGRGGMGEVYRADDLKLGQPVALKFLPADVERDASRRERFMTEVRLSLRVTHPNVCRVFDVGVIDAPASHGGRRHFLSMEYVDGEDLASLLRRIGRLPEDKAIEIARQLCAGLAAAHDEGVLHRDLKPANIMIDGRGRAKIADFGLATLSGAEGTEARAGTPQYMAPEQVAGGELTERTDIYALGLVLYELFTGKRAFEVRNLDDLQRLRSSSPTSPSSHVSGLNVLVERAIMRCLDLDPANRPASAATLAAALPGGDPLAMVIAAGDTPSPEMVAAAGPTARMSPMLAWSLVATLVVASLGGTFLAQHVLLYRAGIPEKSPEILRERARELLAGYGFETPVDREWGLIPDYTLFTGMSEGRTVNPLELFKDRGLVFWYRESPVFIEKWSWSGPDGIPRPVVGDPPLFYSNETQSTFNRSGLLTSFVAVPMQVPASTASSTVNWASMFLAAGLQAAEWTPTASSWTPQLHSDARYAWVRAGAPPPDGPIRVEASSFLGRPTSFALIFPWTKPEWQEVSRRSNAEKVGDLILVLTIASVMFASALLARRNLIRERADRRGAMRLGAFTASIAFAVWLGDESHVPSIMEFYYLVVNTGMALFLGAFVAVFYLSLEPYVRRTWPHMLVSWSRVMAGTVRDPLVARDVLLGLAGAGLVYVLIGVGILVARGITGIPPRALSEWRPLLGGRHILTTFLYAANTATLASLIQLFLVFSLRRLLRNEWAGVIAAALLLSVASGLGDGTVIAILPYLALNLLLFSLLSRVGLVALLTLWFAVPILQAFPLTIPPAGWAAGRGAIGVLALTALAIVCARIATSPATPRRSEAAARV